MSTDKSKQSDEHKSEFEQLMRELLKQLQIQTKLLSKIMVTGELDNCLLEKIGHIVCLIANETHRQTELHRTIHRAIDSFLEMYKSAHPEQTLQLDKIEKLRAELLKFCPSEEKVDLICTFEPCKQHGGINTGDGYSMKSKGYVYPVPFSKQPHRPWKIVPHPHHEADKYLPIVPQGDFVGQIVPSAPTLQVLDFGTPSPTPGTAEPVKFRTFSKGTLNNTTWPPDMSGAKAGDVVLMSGNLFLKLSLDGGKTTFTHLDFTKLFAADKTYGGWTGDQVIHYVPSIDCFVLYVQSNHSGTGTNFEKNVVKVALASPDDLKKFAGGREAWKAWWRQWDFTSDTFGLGNRWMDFPDLTYGDKFLYITTNVFYPHIIDGKLKSTSSKLFFELPLADLKAGSAFSFQYAHIDEGLEFGSPTQNISDENYWAAHVTNSKIRIYSSKGTDANYFWRESELKNWPRQDGQTSPTPDFWTWLSTSHQIIGATRVNNELWFAWGADSGDGGAGGFKFPQPHIQIAKFDLSKDYELIEPQMQVWNADYAFAYPCLTTNSYNEVGISLAWGGGGKYYGSHAVGILGDYLLWAGESSEETCTWFEKGLDAHPPYPANVKTRWGDYVHLRLAHPDTHLFSAFGYAVLKGTTTAPSIHGGKPDYLYVEFGRDKITPPPIR
jgi:hypothetical protein